MSSPRRPTVWVVGDQLHRELERCATRTPDSHRAVQDAFDEGRVLIASAEGFIRQVRPPHPMPEGARQPGDAAGRRSVGDDRVDVVELRRRRRMGDAPERDRGENVIGMSQWADGGMMATKPYAGGGNYIDSMSDYCRSCRYDRTQQVGDHACVHDAVLGLPGAPPRAAREPADRSSGTRMAASARSAGGS